MSEFPIAGGRDGACRQSPSGAGVTAPGFPPPTADAAYRAAASDFLAGLKLKERKPWPLARTTLVVQMWFQGVSTRLIAEAAGVTKNAIVGKAHRMNLPPRVSPIGQRRGEKREAAPVRTRPTLPPPPPQPPPPSPTVGCAPSLRLVPPAPPQTVWRGRTLVACCWPMGEPRTQSFRYCGDPGVPGRPYCPVHMRTAYVPITRRADRCA